MVLEKDKKLEGKIVVSEDNNDLSDSDHSAEIQRMHSFDVDPMKAREGENGERKVFKPTNKKKMQLTFEDIVIKT